MEQYHQGSRNGDLRKRRGIGILDQQGTDGNIPTIHHAGNWDRITDLDFIPLLPEDLALQVYESYNLQLFINKHVPI